MSFVFWKLFFQRLILAINEVFLNILQGVRILLTHCNRIEHKFWHLVFWQLQCSLALWLSFPSSSFYSRKASTNEAARSDEGPPHHFPSSFYLHTTFGQAHTGRTKKITLLEFLEKKFIWYSRTSWTTDLDHVALLRTIKNCLDRLGPAADPNWS